MSIQDKSLEPTSPSCEHDFSFRVDGVNHVFILKLNPTGFYQVRRIRDAVTEQNLARLSFSKDLEIGTIWFLE
jgi:hypothetical protein